MADAFTRRFFAVIHGDESLSDGFLFRVDLDRAFMVAAYSTMQSVPRFCLIFLIIIDCTCLLTIRRLN